MAISSTTAKPQSVLELAGMLSGLSGSKTNAPQGAELNVVDTATENQEALENNSKASEEQQNKDKKLEDIQGQMELHEVRQSKSHVNNKEAEKSKTQETAKGSQKAPAVKLTKIDTTKLKNFSDLPDEINVMIFETVLTAEKALIEGHNLDIEALAEKHSKGLNATAKDEISVNDFANELKQFADAAKDLDEAGINDIFENLNPNTKSLLASAAVSLQAITKGEFETILLAHIPDKSRQVLKGAFAKAVQNESVLEAVKKAPVSSTRQAEQNVTNKMANQMFNIMEVFNETGDAEMLVEALQELIVGSKANVGIIKRISRAFDKIDSAPADAEEGDKGKGFLDGFGGLTKGILGKPELLVMASTGITMITSILNAVVPSFLAPYISKPISGLAGLASQALTLLTQVSAMTNKHAKSEKAAK